MRNSEKQRETARVRRGPLHPNWKGGISFDRTEYRTNLARKKRSAILEIMGGKCCRCGFDDVRALQIDHVNGGGSQERKTTWNVNILKSFLADEKKYQLLCANCNWIKRAERGEISTRRVAPPKK